MARYLENPRTISLLLAFVLALALAPPARATGDDLIVYDDSLESGFLDYSWAARDLANADPVAAGQASIAFEPDGWAGLFLFSSNGRIDGFAHGRLDFQLRGSVGGEQIRLVLQDGDEALTSITLEPASDRWELRSIALPGVLFDGIVFQDVTGQDQSTLYIDEIVLAATEPSLGAPVTIFIDRSAVGHPINPWIYGANLGSGDQLGDVPFPIRRWGGNHTTRYNWLVDASNRGSDYFFLHIGNSNPDPGRLPHGSRVDRFIDESLQRGLEVILTAPTIGWTPLDTRSKHWSFSELSYGEQTATECRPLESAPPAGCEPDAGNGECDPAVNRTGFCSAAGLIVGNDPADASRPVDPSWVTSWMAHVASRVGTASQGGPRLWALDNEPMLWDDTHRDVSPEPLGYDGLWERTVAYATAIKTADPDARVLGPVVWGWCAYYGSAVDDAHGDSCIDGPDREAHGGVGLIEWYLQQVCAHEAETGLRLVDYLDVHFYPHGGVSGTREENAHEDPETASRRLESVRDLWDPEFTSTTWIGEPIALLPRLRGWIDSNCPGMGLALTEYKWGGDDGLSAALAQVDVLGILGREGMDIAARWTAPRPGTLTEHAFRLYLNYDGQGSGIRGRSVPVAVSDDVAVGAYAILGAEDQLFVVLVNRDSATRPISLRLNRDAFEGPSELFRLDRLTGVREIDPSMASGGELSLDLPPRTATLAIARNVTQRAPDGLWYNPNRVGHGIEIGHAGAREFLIWYTYGEDGSPTWYISDAESGSLASGQDLLRFTFDPTSASPPAPTVVGSARVETDVDRAIRFHWTLGDEAATERMFELRGGGRLHRRTESQRHLVQSCSSRSWRDGSSRQLGRDPDPLCLRRCWPSPLGARAGRPGNGCARHAGVRERILPRLRPCRSRAETGRVPHATIHEREQWRDRRGLSLRQRRVRAGLVPRGIGHEADVGSRLLGVRRAREVTIRTGRSWSTHRLRSLSSRRVSK